MSLRIARDESLVTTNAVTTSASNAIDVGRAKVLSVQCVVDVNTPSAKVFAPSDVDVTEDTITKTAHGFPTGLKGQLTTVTTLPDGLSLATDYFVISVDTDTYQLALSLADALAGIAIDIIDQGTGNHTFTPTALAGATVTLLKSNDGTNYDAVEAATAITADATIWISDIDPEYKYAKLSYTLTAGSLSAASHIIIKEDL